MLSFFVQNDQNNDAQRQSWAAVAVPTQKGEKIRFSINDQKIENFPSESTQNVQQSQDRVKPVLDISKRWKEDTLISFSYDEDFSPAFFIKYHRLFGLLRISHSLEDFLIERRTWEEESPKPGFRDGGALIFLSSLFVGRGGEVEGRGIGDGSLRVDFFWVGVASGRERMFLWVELRRDLCVLGSW